jgi:phenylpyruvate tautomerase PptA (4-oxalocrotonate tautomerase family)
VRELDATNDKELFRTERSEDDGLWPVYKGESFYIWEPDRGVYYAWADPDVVLDALQKKRLHGNRNKRSAFSEFPPQWVEDPNTLPCLHPRIAFRDVARATDSRTVIAALIPGRVFITNTGPYLLWPKGDERDEAYLLGVLCSIPLDWYARRVVETHVNFHLFNSFPIPRPDRDDPLRRRVEEIAGRLAATDDRFQQWADAVGVPVGSVTSEDEKQDLIAELDAVVAKLYGLDEEDVVHIFETFHDTWDYQPRLQAVLEHFRRLG